MNYILQIQTRYLSRVYFVQNPKIFFYIQCTCIELIYFSPLIHNVLYVINNEIHALKTIIYAVLKCFLLVSFAIFLFEWWKSNIHQNWFLFRQWKRSSFRVKMTSEIIVMLIIHWFYVLWCMVWNLERCHKCTLNTKMI